MIWSITFAKIAYIVFECEDSLSFISPVFRSDRNKIGKRYCYYMSILTTFSNVHTYIQYCHQLFGGGGGVYSSCRLG